MNRDIESYLSLYSSGVITLQECVVKIRGVLEAVCSCTDLRTVAAMLPSDVLSGLHADVDAAPASEEEWARFRLIQCGDWDPAVSFSEIELALAESQGQYYRFVTAWRAAFPEDVHRR